MTASSSKAGESTNKAKNQPTSSSVTVKPSPPPTTVVLQPSTAKVLQNMKNEYGASAIFWRMLIYTLPLFLLLGILNYFRKNIVFFEQY